VHAALCFIIPPKTGCRLPLATQPQTLTIPPLKLSAPEFPQIFFPETVCYKNQTRKFRKITKSVSIVIYLDKKWASKKPVTMPKLIFGMKPSFFQF
jgi:hypothetical protein